MKLILDRTSTVLIVVREEEGGMFTNVTGSAGAIDSANQKSYVVWKKPEGKWQLVFEGDNLVSIYSKP